jgi:hypothetical protein
MSGSKLPKILIFCALLGLVLVVHYRRYVSRYFLLRHVWLNAPELVAAAAAQTPTASESDAPPLPTTRKAGRPGPDNTGPTTPNNLTAMTDFVRLGKPGQTLSGVAIVGSVYIDANNVTLTNFTLNANSARLAINITPGVTGTVISNGSITNTAIGSYAIYGQGQFTAENLNIYNTAGSIFFVGAPNTVLSGCWLHSIGWYRQGMAVNFPGYVGQTGNQHVDDVFMSGGSLKAINNNFDTPNYTTIDGIHYGCACLFFTIEQTQASFISGIDIENNNLDGGGYMFYLMGRGPATIKNNIMGPHYNFGMIYPTYVRDPFTWMNNLDEHGQIVPRPNVQMSTGS